MSWFLIVLLTLIAYHLFGIIMLLIIGAMHIDEDDFMSIYITGLLGVIFLLVQKVVAKIKRYRKQRYGAIVRRKTDSCIKFTPILCKHKDLEYFEHSLNWELVKRYPKAEDIFEGYFTDENGEKIYRTYDLRYASQEEIDEVKNEHNCFNCAHNGKECNDYVCLCEENYCGHNIDDYSKFEPKGMS